jgi:hypothetical protein
MLLEAPNEHPQPDIHANASAAPRADDGRWRINSRSSTDAERSS